MSNILDFLEKSYAFGTNDEIQDFPPTDNETDEAIELGFWASYSPDADDKEA